MFKVLILVCAATLDHAACNPQTATDVVRGPVARSMMQCVKEGQSTLAQSSLAPEPGKQYLKLVCTGQQNS